MFLRKTKQRDPLPVTMSGVRMGERLLQVGGDAAALAGALAAKVGLSGAAAIVVWGDRRQIGLARRNRGGGVATLGWRRSWRRKRTARCRRLPTAERRLERRPF